MSCGRIENGRTPFAALWRVEQNVVGANPINLTWVAPTWVQLLQITANWLAIPAANEDIVLWKNHAGTAFDVDMLRFNPFLLQLQDWVCLDHFVFAPAEEARVQYPNTDGQAVGVELYFQQINK
jgi:hypothetical protein